MLKYCDFNIRIDLHVHSQRYSPCAETLDPEELHSAMAEKNLDGLVLAEHDYMWSQKELKMLNQGLHHRRIYRGIEVTTRNGHFVVIGLRRQRRFPSGISVRALTDQAANQGAVVIWAHPCTNYGTIVEPLTFDRMPSGIAAVEVVSGQTSINQFQRVRRYAHLRGWASVGASDAHHLSRVGCAYTLFAELPADEMAMAEIIRSGQCRPMQNSDEAVKEGAVCF